MDNWTLHHGDALDVMRTLPASSVDLVATDPPYFKVKDEPWDNQWDEPEMFLAWLGECLQEFRRLLKPNGTLYIFASPEMGARVEGIVREYFLVLNNLAWRKSEGFHKKQRKEDLRRFFPQTERIIVAEQMGAGGVGVIGAHIRAARLAAGLTCSDVDIECSPSKRPTGLCYRWEVGNCVPTAEQFLQVMRTCKDDRPGEKVLAEFAELYRPFTVTADVPFTDVWDFPPVAPYPGKHPCEKPLLLMEHIVTTSSHPGAVVLDPFAGSGTTGVAAVKNGRSFIGVEKSVRHHRECSNRLAYGSHRSQQLGLFTNAG